MAIIRGGLHGRPSGNVSGVVYGAARTRVGKVVTARELVYPSNPKTAGQLIRRHIFLESLYATRHLSAALWQDYFNRGIGQLPGYHSMMSILCNATDDAGNLGQPPNTPLGNLHLPTGWSFQTGAGASKTIDITWNAALGLNGTDADEVHCFVAQTAAEVNFSRPAEYFGTSVTRVDAALTITCDKADEAYAIGIFLVGKGTALGLLSPCQWYYATSKA